MSSALLCHHSARQAVAENRGIYSLVAGTGVKIYYALSLHLPGVNMLNTCYHRGKNFRGVVFKPLIASLMLTSAVVYAKPMPLTAARYAQQLGVGMDVDWARTERGIREFDPLVVRDFKAKGLTHVRIRVAGAPTEARLIHLRKLVEACEYYGVIPIIAYQADAYKTDPSASHEKELINWWSVVARYFGQTSPLLGFDLIYEPADKLNHNMASLNRVYDKTIRLIHAIDPQRMIFVAPACAPRRRICRRLNCRRKARTMYWRSGTSSRGDP